ncbi:DUF2577 domain-containing protein [Lactobacillus helveticus]|uniref:DUF2577 domain-containing protein n=1 Tax=Lactobacillus helveticus TaxID=1587 RepID=A0A6A7K119_LACHE|nr:DUF2577 domain-containing protein [Lactobacillus helveticus]MPW14208.1 DUF2577 domain-containing protein [Lactobacillus helveticus]
MAGKRLYELMTKRGGKPSDYSDVVYGSVISPKPLKVQLSNNMVLTNDFIILGKHIGKFKVKGKVTKHDEVKGETELEFDNSLESGDKVTMIRFDGGQQFYLFERIGEDGFGF